MIIIFDEIESLLDQFAQEAEFEANKLFPDHPKAREVWVKPGSSGGGIMDVVKTLGLHGDYRE
jgi:hypothetical protein